jgi:hypothetical protein
MEVCPFFGLCEGVSEALGVGLCRILHITFRERLLGQIRRILCRRALENFLKRKSNLGEPWDLTNSYLHAGEGVMQPSVPRV